MQAAMLAAGTIFLYMIAVGALAGGGAYLLDLVNGRLKEWHHALIAHAQQLQVKKIAERMRRECHWFNNQRDRFLVVAIARCLELHDGFNAQEVRDNMLPWIYNEHGLTPQQDFSHLVELAVKVLQQHCIPKADGGLTDSDVVRSMYEIFDGPEYRAALEHQQLQKRHKK